MVPDISEWVGPPDSTGHRLEFHTIPPTPYHTIAKGPGGSPGQEGPGAGEERGCGTCDQSWGDFTAPYSQTPRQTGGGDQ